MIFLLGVVLGVAGAFVAVHYRAQLGIASAVERLLLAERRDTDTSDVLQNEPLDQLGIEARELQDIIQTPSAVPVEDQPAELPQQSIDEIESANSPKAAFEAAKKYIRNEDVARVYAAAVRWRPQYYHLTERKYQDSLKDHLLTSYKEQHVVSQYKLDWSIDGEKGKAKPDFVLGNPGGPDTSKVLVELKPDLLSSSTMDRALGQMLRYLLAWKKKGPAILIVAGYTTPAIRGLVRYYVKEWRGSMGLPVTVFFKRYDNAADVREAITAMAAGGDTDED